jgi:hypothetical protein
MVPCKSLVKLFKNEIASLKNEIASLKNEIGSRGSAMRTANVWKQWPPVCGQWGSTRPSRKGGGGCLILSTPWRALAILVVA